MFKCNAPVIAIIPYALGVFFAFINYDRPCWYLANIAVAIALLGSMPSWLKSNHPIPGLFSGFLKLSITIYIGYGWWTVEDKHDYTVPALEFFWAMPPFLIVWGLLEEAILARYFTSNSRHGAAV